jgi:hypothetical protein
VLKRLVEALGPHGLNLVAAAPVAAYDAGLPVERTLARYMPTARTAIVIGNGGGAFWDAFRARWHHPELARSPDPLDAFTREVVETTTATVVPPPVRILYPFRFSVEPISFMRLADCAGLGRPSLLGVLIHPRYGPWIALRAALLVPEEVVAPRPADGFDPCPGCGERACMVACPAGAVSDAGWDIPRCAAYRHGPTDPCASRCHARFDCVIGREHRYPDDAMAYHQSRAATPLAGGAGGSGGGASGGQALQ